MDLHLNDTKLNIAVASKKVAWYEYIQPERFPDMNKRELMAGASYVPHGGWYEVIDQVRRTLVYLVLNEIHVIFKSHIFCPRSHIPSYEMLTSVSNSALIFRS